MLNFNAKCNLCPHNCYADRKNGQTGFCNLDDKIYIDSICRHRGEEPPVSGEHGICNVFFSHCNLQCLYCQNHQISCNTHSFESISLQDTVNQICKLLDTGIRSLGFVSPSQQIPQMIQIIQRVRDRGYNPVIVYNTNSYDKVETLRELETWVDVYLADLKYSNEELGQTLSGVKNYNSIAIPAIQEMIRQKGISLALDNEGIAIKGVMIRHLVLPGFIDNSIKILDQIADMLDSKITLSLMSQYYPAFRASEIPNLSRTLHASEYQRVVDYLQFLEINNGWVQELESHDNYQPDFENDHPFE